MTDLGQRPLQTATFPRWSSSRGTWRQRWVHTGAPRLCLLVCVCVYTCIYIRYMQPCMLACIHNRSDSVPYLRARTHTNTHRLRGRTMAVLPSSKPSLKQFWKTSSLYIAGPIAFEMLLAACLASSFVRRSFFRRKFNRYKKLAQVLSGVSKAPALFRRSFCLAARCAVSRKQAECTLPP